MRQATAAAAAVRRRAALERGFSSAIRAASRTFDVVNPATEEVIATLPADSAEDVRNKFEAARAAQRSWARSPLAQRQNLLQRFGELLAAEETTLAQQLTAETGKPVAQARGEVRGTVARLRALSELAPEALAPRIARTAGAMEERVMYEPLGVVAHISAWNYPFFIASNAVAAALLTGNAVLYKASEHAALSGAAIARLLREAGVPAGAFVACQGGAETGAALAALEGLGSICFTGSLATGRKVAAAAAVSLTRVNLELGGKDPVYVRADVPDVAAAAAAIAAGACTTAAPHPPGIARAQAARQRRAGAFANAGQSCCSVERIYVHADVAAPFTEAFVAAVRGFSVGDPSHERTYIGPVARRPAVEHLRRQVADAVEKGARVLVGGPGAPLPPRGFYVAPTVLADVDHSMEVMREESFGPVAPIQVVRSDGEAVALMADTHYGLTAGVFTADGDVAAAVLRALDVGTGYWNACDRTSAHVPWSGRRGSGLGCTLGLDGLRTLVQPKALHLLRSKPKQKAS